MEHENIQGYEPVSRYFGDVATHRNSISRSFVIFVYDLAAELPYKNASTHSKWLKTHTSLIPDSRICTQSTFLYLLTSPKANQGISDKLQAGVAFKKCIISTMGITHLCEMWGENNHEILLPIPVSKLNYLSELSKMGQPSRSQMVIWKIRDNVEDQNFVIKRMNRLLLNCANLPPLRHQTWFESPVDRVAHAYAHIWLDIMDNYTLGESIQLTFNFLCSKDEKRHHLNIQFVDSGGIGLYFRRYVKNLHVFPYFPQDDMSALNFISCGERGLTPIPFSELTVVFDKIIWLLIIITMVTILIPLRSLTKQNVGITSHIMSSVKLLLEQGNPFMACVSNDDRVRWIVGAFLLTGTVLSNAYKNANVYNMVAPRRPVPYKYFKELVKDNFTIYSRVHSASFSHDPQFLNFTAKNFRKIAGPKVVAMRENENGAGLVSSEFAELFRSVTNTLIAVHRYKHKEARMAANNGSLGLPKRSDKTMLHPKILQLLQAVVNRIFNGNSNQIPDDHVSHLNKVETKQLISYEEEMFYKTLNLCARWLYFSLIMFARDITTF